jgi:preprotein translocase subunit SecG
MVTFIQILHIILSIILIGIILMQSSKGHGLSGAFGSFGGGAMQSMFGARTGDFLVKTTSWLAVIFFASAFFLAYFQVNPTKSVLHNYKGFVSETPTKQAEVVGKKLGDLTGDLLKKVTSLQGKAIEDKPQVPSLPRNDSNTVQSAPLNKEVKEVKQAVTPVASEPKQNTTPVSSETTSNKDPVPAAPAK